jgi:hypothetical protein
MTGRNQLIASAGAIGPLLAKLSRDQVFEFYFPDGPIELKSPAPELGGVFTEDDGPFYSWFTYPEDEMIASSPSLRKAPTPADVASVSDALEELYVIAEEHGPFEGVFGFSQGATLGAGWLMQHERLARDPMDPPPFALARFIVLFNAYGIGIADVGAAVERECGNKGGDTGELQAGRRSNVEDDGYTRPMKLNTPSLHVCGRLDRFLPGSMALLSTCEQGTATLMMHDEGHVVPRGAKTVNEMARAIEELMHRAVV